MAGSIVHLRQWRVRDRCFFAFAPRVQNLLCSSPSRPRSLPSLSQRDFQSSDGGVDSQVKKSRDKICLYEATNSNFIFCVVVLVNTGSAVSSVFFEGLGAF